MANPDNNLAVKYMARMDAVTLDTEEVVALLDHVSDFRNMWGQRSKQDDRELNESMDSGIIPELMQGIVLHQPEPNAAMELLDGVGRVQQAIKRECVDLLGFMVVRGASDVEMLRISAANHAMRKRIKETLRGLQVANAFSKDPDVSLAMKATLADQDLDHMRKYVKIVDSGLEKYLATGQITFTQAHSLTMPRNAKALKAFLSGRLKGKQLRAALEESKEAERQKRVRTQVSKLDLTPVQRVRLLSEQPDVGIVETVVQQAQTAVVQADSANRRLDYVLNEYAKATLMNGMLQEAMARGGIDVGVVLTQIREFMETDEGQGMLKSLMVHGMTAVVGIKTPSPDDVPADEQRPEPLLVARDDLPALLAQWKKEREKAKPEDYRYWERSKRANWLAEYEAQHPKPIAVS